MNGDSNSRLLDHEALIAFAIILHTGVASTRQEKNKQFDSSWMWGLDKTKERPMNQTFFE